MPVVSLQNSFSPARLQQQTTSSHMHTNSPKCKQRTKNQEIHPPPPAPTEGKAAFCDYCKQLAPVSQTACKIQIMEATISVLISNTTEQMEDNYFLSIKSRGEKSQRLDKPLLFESSLAMTT